MFSQVKLFIISFIVALFHEAGHIIFAKAFGFRVKSISVLPFGVNSEIEFSDSNYKRLIVIYAGPFVNVLLILLAMFLKNTADFNFVRINFYMLVINLIPVYPLDGGRALNEFLDNSRENYEKVRKIYLIFSVTVLIFGCMYMMNNKFNCSLIIIGLFLISQLSKYKPDSNTKISMGLCNNIWVYDDVKLYELAGKLIADELTFIYVIDRNGNLIGTTTGKALFKALFESKYHYKINELLINGGENERF